MKRRHLSASSSLVLLFAACASSAAPPSRSEASVARPAPATQGSSPSAGMLRNPDVSATDVVFSYANDLWVVAREGGEARPLSSPRGLETRPKFSPDGQSIAFVGNYDGDVDVYVMPVAGGAPARLTYHPADEQLTDWADEGSIVFHANGETPRPRMNRIYRTTPGGGLPEVLPIAYGGNAALNADGTKLAFTQHIRDERTWKRYRGGLAADIWLYDLTSGTAELVTDWEGTDSIPMWHGDVVYYLSDAGPEVKLNIWAYDVGTKRRRQVTRFDVYDCKWPSIGPGASGEGEIVLQNGAKLHLVSLADGSTRALDIRIPGDRPTIRPQRLDAGEELEVADVSPTGKRVVASARGDVWTLAAENGAPRNLTHTSGVAERYPTWSPDGRWIAYASDVTGEYEVWVAQSDGKGEPRRLTEGNTDWISILSWSPDSETIYASDDKGRMRLIDVASGATTDVDLNESGGEVPVSWSHDSAWLAYARGEGYMETPAIFLYDVANATRHRVTSGMLAEGDPTFDRKGEFLYYTSNGAFSPTMASLTTDFVYRNTTVVLAVPLRADVKNPLAPELDEEKFDSAEKDEDASEEPEGGAQAEDADEAKEEGEVSDDADEAKKEEDEPPLRIDLDGFEERAFRLAVPAGSYGGLNVNDKGQLVFLSASEDGPPSVVLFDPAAKDAKVETIVSGTPGYAISADGKKLAVSQSGKPALVDAAAGATAKPIPTDGMNVVVDPRAEWRQVLRDAWRLFRIYFYDPGMHGVDWDAEYERYAAMLDDCATRDDVGFLIGEMISELNVGHAYYRHRPSESGPDLAAGLLGCDFELADGAYRIARIYEGGPWDTDARSPLRTLGNAALEGEYLLAVNGTPVETRLDPRAAFVGLADRVTTLTVSPSPTLDDQARDVVVTPISDERELRYRAWIEANRRYVEERSGGRIGYLYVPNTAQAGMNDLSRHLVGQLRKDALIVDERWNQGGFIPSRLVEMLKRPALAYFAGRSANFTWPPDGHNGPKAMLINGPAGSGGDCLPYFFRQAGLGKLIGKRTWGGLVGLSGNPGLIDGTAVAVPTFAFFELDGTWGVEGHGVDPDLDVEDDPSALAHSIEPQLDAAISRLLEELEEGTYRPLDHPRHPVRTGIGIEPSDR